MANCLRVQKPGTNQAVIQEFVRRELTQGEVLIKNHYSSINYKDALAVTGQGKILRNFPLIPGIDACGEVIESNSQSFEVGDFVLQTGCNLGEQYDGGLSEEVILNEANCLALPESITPQQAMTIGTAGFTAALAIMRMQINNLSKEKPVVVTGASGGVGSFAVQLLKLQGFDVIAVTGKESAHDWLKQLGADKVLKPEQILTDKPMDSIQWSGAIDNIGGQVLTSLLAQTDLYGHVASIGLADSFKLNATVMPFILRGVSLIGVSSNNCPMLWRKKIWQSFAQVISQFKFYKTQEVSLKDVENYSQKLLQRKVQGRMLVTFV